MVREANSTRTNKVGIRLRKDIFSTASSLKQSLRNNWHIPQDGLRAHVRRLFNEAIPFGSSENTALASKAQLGYEGDDDISNSSDDDENQVPAKGRKIYYEGKIGGPPITSPSYKYYTPASPAYSPVTGQTHWTDNLEVSTLIFNPFKSNGDTTDDESYEFGSDNSNNGTNEDNCNSNNISNNISNKMSNNISSNNNSTPTELDEYYFSLFSE